ncbi:MAG: NDP-sugar synthase [Pseudomonadota bacterium]
MRVKQAMLLAAGLSTRLRPLTDEIPKPLLPFWNRTVLDVTVAYLKDAGITAAAVNVHHGRDRFLSVLQQRHPIRLVPFVEETILGTGGGIKNMRRFITDRTFVVANCDVIADVDLVKAIRFHLSKKSIATMVLAGHRDLRGYKTIGVQKDGRITSFPYSKVSGDVDERGLFSGIHIFDRAIFSEFPDVEIFDINQNVYGPLLDRGGPVFAYVSPAPWIDLGETRLYAAAQFDLLEERPKWLTPFLKNFTGKTKKTFVAKNASVAKDAVLHAPLLIAAKATVEGECRIGPSVVLGPRSSVGPGCSLDRVVVLPDAHVPAGTTSRRQIFTAHGPVAF